MLLGLAIWMLDRFLPGTLILALWAAAVCASSLLTHQHTIADVAGGLVLAGLGSFLFRYLILRQTKPGLAH